MAKKKKRKMRKDVLIARIIFVFLLLILGTGIAFGVRALRSYLDSHKTVETQQTETTTEENPLTNVFYEPSDTEAVIDIPGTEAVTETTEAEAIDTPDTAEDTDTDTIGGAEEVTTLVTTEQINFRTEPNTDCAIIGSIPKGSQLTLESYTDDQWAYVLYNGKHGYVNRSYITEE